MKLLYVLFSVLLFTACSVSKKSAPKRTSQPQTIIKENISNGNSVEYQLTNTDHIGSGSTEVIFTGDNNEVIFEQINSLYNSNNSHLVIIIDGSNNQIKITTSESVINSSNSRDTLRITGNYNIQKFIREFVIENDSISSNSEIIGNLNFDTYTTQNKHPTFDTTEIANKFTNYYDPAFKVIEYYMGEADSGNLEAHFYLGEIYLKGIGGKKDLTKSKFHFYYAAQKNHVNSIYFMGHILEYEEGNLPGALKWYYKAADHGHILAMDRIVALETDYEEEE